MSQLSAKQEHAVALVAEDTKTNAEIAEAVGIVPRTLDRWKSLPQFQARVASYTADVAAAITTQGIADRQYRVNALQAELDWIEEIRIARARAMAAIPGGKTGMMVEDIKLAANGDTVCVYAPDTVLLRERRAALQQAAQELGQWTEKRDLTSDGQQIVPNVVIVLPQKDDAPDLTPPDA